MTETDTEESLSLKWGTLKSWNLKTDKSREVMKRYIDFGMTGGAMQQKDTPEQKQLICELIDALNCETIWLDWDGVQVSKDDAKKYVMEY